MSDYTVSRPHEWVEEHTYDDGTVIGYPICKGCDQASSVITNGLCRECEPKVECPLCGSSQTSLHNVGACLACVLAAGAVAVAERLEGGRMIPPAKWQWFGNAGHFIGCNDCAFHMTTKVGDFVVSTVGEYDPQRTQDLEKMKTLGYGSEDGGPALYETFTFEHKLGGYCSCGCGLPDADDFGSGGGPRWSTAAQANAGHLAACFEAASEGAP